MKTNGNVAGDPVNTPSEKPVRTRSRFPSLSMHFYNTERFGEYNVCDVLDCESGDRVPFRSGGTVGSYSLKAPLMQSLFKKKDFYMVPMEAILPNNWQKFYTNPVVGEDVPDDCGTGYSKFWSDVFTAVRALFNQTVTNIANTDLTTADILNSVFRTAVFGEYFYSAGSLIKSLRASGDRFSGFTNSDQFKSYDVWFDQLCLAVIGSVSWFEFVADGDHYIVVNDSADYDYLRASYAVVPFRTYLQMLRDDLTVYIVDYDSAVTQEVIAPVLSPFFGNSTWVHKFAKAEIDYDLRRLWAYQLVCSHFYTNDHIDYIYSADLFRSLIEYFCFTKSDGTYSAPTFTCNGIAYRYDGMSAECASTMFSRITTSPNAALTVAEEEGDAYDYVRNSLAYFSCLFGYRRSLRYVDYFTGSRSRPLAVGDVNVDVNSGDYVSVVDISRNIQRQRFFNAVNRFGRRFEEYIKGLSGITPDVDYHNPLYLSHTQDTVFGVQVENTGAAQQSEANSITSRLMSNGSRYQFEFEVDRPCVVIGLSYYDLPRAYSKATERQLFYMNRFDMFNPYMQFIGDQAVKFAELGCQFPTTLDTNFGYQLRHMEYKQRYDQCAGGFIENLPGYLFTDQAFANAGFMTISPSFIRSLSTELDSFYVSLTGYSLGSYFHFIVDNDNYCDASRPMAFAPSIL